MSYPPPPAPLDRETVERRWAAGARTMRELDPELWAWLQARRRFRVFATIALLAGLVVLAVTFGIGASS